MRLVIARCQVDYVGRLTARKGVLYLLDALRSLKPRDALRLTLCTRGLAGSELLKSYSDLPVDLKVGLSGERLAAELRACDLFDRPLDPSDFDAFLERRDLIPPAQQERLDHLLATRDDLVTVQDLLTEYLRAYRSAGRAG